MSAVAAPSFPPTPGSSSRRWTREEFYRLGDLGFFDGRRAELIEGEIVVRGPLSWPHTAAMTRVNEGLRATFGAGFWVRTRLPVVLGPASELEPDVSVVAGRRDDYADHPTAAVLVVEVADTTLATDRTRKMSLYAAAGVPEYWVVNLPDRRLEVYRDPVPDPAQPSGHRYARVAELAPGDVVTPAAVPGARVPVGGLFA